MSGAYGGAALGGAAYVPVVAQSSFSGTLPYSIITEVAFTSNPLDDPAVWVDVSLYVRSISTNRGRQHELNRFEAGTATIVLDNKDGRFSPFNTSSPYNPNVLPFKQIRVRALYNGVVYPIFRGHIQAWPVKWPSPNDSTVEIACVDATKALNLKKATNLSSYSSTILTDTPTRYWTLGDAPGLTVAVDSSGNGASATVVNNATSAASDKPAFFGAAGAVVASPDSAFDCGNAKGMIARGVQSESFGASFSVEAWVNLRQATGQIFQGRNASKTFSVSVNDGSNAATVSGTVHVSSDNSINIVTLDGLIPIADGKWHHIVVVTNSATSITLYVDGVQDQTVATVNTLGASTLSLGFGGIPNIFSEGGTPSLNGVIDELAVYASTVLSATQIANHYVAGALPRRAEMTGTRIAALLSAVGYPASLQKLDTGLISCQAGTNDLINNPALANAQVTADTELGALFVGADGSIVFYDHTHQYKSPNGIAGVTLGDSGVLGPGGESPYLLTSVNIAFDDLDLFNEATVTPTGQGAQTASDTTSQTTYGKRTVSKAGVQFSTADALGEAQWLVGKYKTPLQRISSISFTPLSDPTVLLPAALGFELLTRVNVKRRPKDASSSTFSQDSLIEGVEHHIVPGMWTTTWRLSPTDASPIMWIIEDPVAGKIVDGASQSPPVAIGF
jgi:hypothetical protein